MVHIKEDRSMKSVFARGTCTAAVLAMGTVVFAQSTGQTQPPTSTTPQTAATQPSQADQVTITGCIQREADYRAAHNMGSGGVAGTGVGAANEYILVNATAVRGASSAVGTSGSTPTETGATAAAPAAYELTGSNEGQAGQFVGKRVEISGKLKAAETSATGAPTGGATAGKPPTGTDVVSKDLKLREIEVTSIKEATGTCPAK
jgi:hypothetical protein